MRSLKRSYARKTQSSFCCHAILQHPKRMLRWRMHFYQIVKTSFSWDYIELRGTVIIPQLRANDNHSFPEFLTVAAKKECEATQGKAGQRCFFIVCIPLSSKMYKNDGEMFKVSPSCFWMYIRCSKMYQDVHGCSYKFARTPVLLAEDRIWSSLTASK